jgi:hypothetical protein
MSKNMGAGQGPAQKPGESLEQLDNLPLWSPWNLQTTERDWHQVIYDEMRSSYMKRENT